MKPSDRVNRIQEQQPNSATVLQVRWDTVLIEYDEGGQGWWPMGYLEIIDNTDWPRFKRIALGSDTLKAIAIAAHPTEPIAAGALSASLYEAEKGDIADFAGAWKLVCAAANVTPEVVAGFVSVAEACNLPAAFVAALQSFT